MLETKVKTVKTPLEIVKEIHHKVLTSGERCLEESKVIQASTTMQDYDLVQKMEARGFGKTKEVIEKKAEIEKNRLAIERAKNVQHYGLYYTQKYIPVEEMEAICKEYNLIMGADKHYIGSIPTRSQLEIVNFKLRDEDVIYQKGVFKSISSAVDGNERTLKGTIEWSEIEKEQYMQETMRGTNLIKDNNRTHYITNKDYFILCAPKEMFELEGVIVDGVQMKEVIEIKEIHDPICLQPVKNGFLVVAVWGEELAIEAMKNPKMN